jgi:hypothetical protein
MEISISSIVISIILINTFIDFIAENLKTMLEKYRTIFLKIPSYSTQPKLRFLPLAII